MGPNFVDEIDCNNLFDEIDDLIEFAPDIECGVDGNLVSRSDGKDFETWNDALLDCDLFLSGGHVNSASDFSAELSVPYEDIFQLEWLSTFVEDSFSCRGLTLAKDNLFTNNEPSTNQFQISSPISVLESSSSISSDKTLSPLCPNHHGPQRARSKRLRPPTSNPRPVLQLLSPSSSSAGTAPRGLSSESDYFAESPPIVKKIRKNPTGDERKKKSKKIRITLPANNPLATAHEDSAVQPVRKCLHCEITNTPQWRSGPMGPKTLCNACGVRHKSGRLFPEYRPAASPTFVPSLHSNSHKKVVEMRSKVGPEARLPHNACEDPKDVPNA